jgi:hypothetical protein
MIIHDMSAIQRNIQFKENVTIEKHVHASDRCCWNCLWSVMTYECLWCEQEMDMVDFRDLCTGWEGDTDPGNA